MRCKYFTDLFFFFFQDFVKGTNITTTEDPYLICRKGNASIQTTTPSPDSYHTTSVPALPTVCDDEEELYFGMASVVHTDIWSSREGAICNFVGGNRHSPFHPGIRGSFLLNGKVQH